MQKNNQVKTVGLVIIITLIGRVMGLGRDMLMAHNLGTGWQADALAAASQLPRTFFDAIFASAVSASFIPVFNAVMTHSGKDEAHKLANSFLTIVGLAAAGLTILGILFAQPLISLLTNFDQRTAELAVVLLRVIFPTLLFAGLAFSAVGILNSYGEFNIPAAMTIVSNGVLIVYFAFFVGRFGVYGAAVAFLLGWAAQALIQLPSLRKKGYRYRPQLRHPGLRDIFALMLPVMVSTWVAPINMLVSIQFASAIPGGAAGMNLAKGLFIMIAGIFVLSVTNVIFPEMSRLSATGEREKLGQVVSSSMQTLLFLLIPMTVGLKVLATPLIRLLYEYRAFDAASTALTSSALFFLCLGMVGYGVQNVLIRAFYAEKNGKVPMISGLLSIGTNLVLCLLLVNVMGLAGVALATAISFFVAAVVLVPPAHNMLGKRLITPALLVALGKMLAAALIMGAVALLVDWGLSGILSDGFVPRVLRVAVPTLVGIVVYGGLAHVFRLSEVSYILGLTRKGKGK